MPSASSLFILCPAAALLALGSGCGSPDGNDKQNWGANDTAETGTTRVRLGSLRSVLEDLRLAQPGTSSRYTFPMGAGAGVPVLVQEYAEEEDRIGMIGRTEDSHDSEFILKVNRQGLYAWLVDRDRDVAWEYTTSSDGTVWVEKVPVTKIFAVCAVPPEQVPRIEPDEDRRLLFNAPANYPPHVLPFPGGDVDVTKLQSRPESENVYYIDLTDVMNGTEPKSGHSKEDVWVSWQIAAATHWQFDVNVTTDAEAYSAAGVTRSICSRMNYQDRGGSSSCGLNTFGTQRCCDNKLYNNGYGTGRILNHEVGHGWGLRHDGGDNGGEYFNGFSEFEWTPLMGNVWPGDRWSDPLYQWSLGEYDSATLQEDDLQIITRSVDFVEDDIPDGTPLVFDGTSVTAEANWGHIGRNVIKEDDEVVAVNLDTDSWTFEIGPSGGHATLTITRIEHIGGSMLDVSASILDAAGTVIIEDNGQVDRGAELDVDLPAGSYELVVEGGGEGTPAHGFSNYSSLGLYGISGTLTGAVDSDPGTGAGGMGGMGGSTGVGGTGGTTAGGMGGDAGMAAAAGSAGFMAGGSAGTAGGGASGSAGIAGSPTGGAGYGGAAVAGSASVPVVTTAGDPGGCACTTGPRQDSPAAWWAALGAGLVLTRRRQRT